MDPAEYVSPTPSSEDGNRSSFRNVVFFRIPDDGQNTKRTVILSATCIHQGQDPSECNHSAFLELSVSTILDFMESTASLCLRGRVDKSSHL
jgi:hypothetical protein